MAILTEEDRLSYRIFFLIAVVALLAVPVTGLRLLAALVIICYLPAAPFAARAGLPFHSAIALVVNVSPLMIALPVMAVMLLGLPVQTAVWAIVGISMAQFLTYGTQRGLSTTAADKRLLVALASVIAVVAALTLWLPSTSTWWQYREDSWFHAAIFRRISNFGLPAVDPYFSPLKLQYMYFYHIFLLTVSTLTGLGPFHAMIFANFIAIAGCVLGFSFLGGMFTSRPTVRVTGVILCMFAMNGLFYLFFPLRLARAFWGDAKGIEVLKEFYSLNPLGHESAVRFVTVEGNQHLFLDKFMLGTALSLTLGLVSVLLALMLTARRGRWTWILSFFYAAALSGTMFLHVVMGATVAAATLGVVVVIAIFDRGRRDGDDGRFTIGRQALLTVLSVVIAVPYTLSVMPRSGVGSSISLDLQFRQVFGVLSCILPVLIPAAWYLVRGERLRTFDTGGARLSPSGILAVWAAIVMAIALFVDLPANNETKFAFPMYIALSALAVGGFDYWFSRSEPRGGRGVGGRSRLLVAYLALCALPLNAVYFTGAFADRTEFRISPSELSLYDWIRKTTRDDAIFLEANDIVRIPVLAERDQYWGTEHYAHIWGYPPDEMNVRRALRDAIFGDSELTDAVLQHAAALRRPFYVVLRNIHDDQGKKFKSLANDPRLTGKFMYEDIAVFELDLRLR